MHRSFSLAICLFALAMGLAGCAGRNMEFPPFAPTRSEVIAGNADSGQTIRLYVGQILAVRLAENPTTPCHLEPRNAERGGILASRGSTYVQDPAPPMYVGVGGVRTFRFEAKKAGTVTLRIVDACLNPDGGRPFQNDAATYRVVVR